jgi:hypothetical protein
LHSEFDAHKAIEETGERAEHAHGGSATRNILLVAAIIAVVAAITSLFANQRATAALQAKNDAILAQAKSSDAYNFYQARSIKSHIYDAAILSAARLSPVAQKKLSDTMKHEGRDQKKLLAEAQDYEKQVEGDVRKSEELMHSHEILEASVTFFEVAIAIVSIAGITTSRGLVVLGSVAALVGVVLAVWGFLPPPTHAGGVPH